MLRVLLSFFHRPALRFGLSRDERHGRLRDPRFVSFIAQSNRKVLNTDRHDFLLWARKMTRRMAVAAAALGCTWIVVESAKALTVF